MGERRRSIRLKSFLRGCVYFNNGQSSADCFVRDISHDGARIIFSDNLSIPDSVQLHIPDKRRTICARVKWRRGNEIGLAFSENARKQKEKPYTLKQIA
jgi:PilZ domain